MKMNVARYADPVPPLRQSEQTSTSGGVGDPSQSLVFATV